MLARDLSRGCGELGLGLRDRRLLQTPGSVKVGERGLLTGDGGGRLCQRGPVVPVVELQEQVAGMDFLVIGDRDLSDEAGDLRRDHRYVAAHIGVVRALDEAPDGPPIVAVPPGARRGQKGGPGERQPLA